MTRTNDRTNLLVILGLGANLGDPLWQLRKAVELVEQTISVTAISSVYLTEPVGFEDQPQFYNLVLCGTTGETVYGVHSAIKAAEGLLGRDGEHIRNGPRAIDVDLLAFGELVLASGPLTVPHPRMLERSFVLQPLGEILPRWRHPLTRHTASESFSMLDAPSHVELIGSLAALRPALERTTNLLPEQHLRPAKPAAGDGI